MINSWQYVHQIKLFYIADGNIDWYKPFEKLAVLINAKHAYIL